MAASLASLPAPVVCEARAVDIDAVAELCTACFEEAWGHGSLSRVLGSPGAFGLLERSDEAAVGFVLCRVALDESELLSLGVAPAHRRRGVGGRLLDAASACAAQAGARVMFLEVAEDNLSARRLYGTAGFVRVGRRPGYYGRADGARVAALVLRRPLAPHDFCKRNR